MPATTAEALSLVTRTVSVAPLVLLSTADHFGRSGKGLRKRVVGVLLGQNDSTNVRVSNSFAGKLFTIFLVIQAYLSSTKSPSRRTTRTRQSGFWTTTTSNP